MNCRTRKKKEVFCKQYYIQPVNYIKLLNGQNKEGCCGPLDDKYYTFSYKPKGDYETQAKYFFVGTHCANEFLDIIRQNPLPLFNPLTHEQNSNTSSGNSSGLGNKTQRVHPFNQELLTAINMLCITWDIIPESGLESIISFTRKRSDQPNYKGLEWFNKMVAKDSQERSLRKMIDELRMTNELKQMDFKLLNQYLNDIEIKNHIG